ncbi:hypothetical protein WJX73_004411 [Symbiochloris irregularis]|uniref:Uncharacterized protein n=1 Tax=Symbiochloris irregularis TaxID=706552 RepID=A0AAW1NQH6_9CHLO
MAVARHSTLQGSRQPQAGLPGEKKRDVRTVAAGLSQKRLALQQAFRAAAQGASKLSLEQWGQILCQLVPNMPGEVLVAIVEELALQGSGTAALSDMRRALLNLSKVKLPAVQGISATQASPETAKRKLAVKSKPRRSQWKVRPGRPPPRVLPVLPAAATAA